MSFFFFSLLGSYLERDFNYGQHEEESLDVGEQFFFVQRQGEI